MANVSNINLFETFHQNMCSIIASSEMIGSGSNYFSSDPFFS